MNKIIFNFTIACFCFYFSESMDARTIRQNYSDSLVNNDSKESVRIYERSFKPSFYDTEVYLYGKTDTTSSLEKPVEDFATAPPETLQGFRIQLLATTNYDEAIALRNDLNRQYTDLWVYTVFEAPTYKVRIGDFINRADAKPMIDKFKIDGFKTAWIVPDKIIRNQGPKPIPPPLPADSTTVK